MSAPLYGVNTALADTIKYDRNLSEEAKLFFHDLCAFPTPELANGMNTAACALACTAELLKRNYVYIEGLGSWCVTPPDRRSRWTKVKDFFRNLFQRKPATPNP